MSKHNPMKKALLLLVLAFPMLTWSAPVTDKHVSVELISEVSTIAAGEPFWVALKISHEEHWHTYWINDGDSGLPTKIDWQLPEGFTAGPIVWPYPQKIIMAPLVSYGFEGDAYLLVQITPPEKLPDTPAELKARVSWLMCKEVCIPGKANLSISLTTGSETKLDPAQSSVFETARRNLPSDKSDWKFSLNIDDSTIRILATPPPGAQEITSWDLFAIEKGIVAASLDKQWGKTSSGYEMVLTREVSDDPLPDFFRAVLVSNPSMSREAGKNAIEIALPFTIAAQPSTDLPPEKTYSLLIICSFAFLGGIILNLMPCVFPVISLKILGFVNQARQDPRAVWHHGLVFAAGVMVSFWILAGLLIALRAGGESIGWGFQLQSPHVLIVLCLLFFTLALNLFGVFELGLSLTSSGGSLADRQGWSGSFFSGFLATVIATPCTAPFMGVALGYALTQPAYVSMIVFTSLALGMAFPYLLLSRFPSMLKILPRPGAWMETMKQIMGFFLLATVIWLYWVLASLVSTNTLTFVLAAFLMVGIAVWILGKWDTLVKSGSVRWRGRIAAALFVVAAVALGFNHIERNNASVASGGDQNGWEAFTPERLAELRAEGKPVFIDFTAKWCLTCQVNKLSVLHKANILQAFKDKNVTLMSADWTDENEIIAKELAKHGRQSVPLYLLYPSSSSGEPQKLPEILTQNIVLEALSNLN